MFPAVHSILAGCYTHFCDAVDSKRLPRGESWQQMVWCKWTLKSFKLANPTTSFVRFLLHIQPRICSSFSFPQDFIDFPCSNLSSFGQWSSHQTRNPWSFYKKKVSGGLLPHFCNKTMPNVPRLSRPRIRCGKGQLSPRTNEGVSQHL